MEFRAATPDEFDAIVRLVPTQEELFLVYPNGKHPFTVDQLRTLADTRRELTVAVHDGEIVGFADLYNVEPGLHAFIGNVIVGRPFRGKGLGRALVTHMAQTVFGKYDTPEVRISVFNDNATALLLYSSLGFKPYAIEERADPSGKRVALIHMALHRDAYRTQSAAG